MSGPDIAVIIPCKNESAAIAKVVDGFRCALPTSTIYVYDNCSEDDTFEIAQAAGALVRREPRPGKGHVVCRMLADIDADVYVMVDGDDTYDPKPAAAMVQMLVDDVLDMVVAIRMPEDAEAAYRRGHVLGNRLFTNMHERLFGRGVTDVFSGYRVLSRRFAKTFPATSSGFEIEAEMTAHALTVGAAIGEVNVSYRDRSVGSSSKLRTYRDGLRILLKSLVYFKEARPARFFGLVFVLLTMLALGLGIPVIAEYFDTKQVPRLPTAIAATGIQLVAFIALTSGVILDSLARSRREMKRLAYLSFDAPRPPVGRTWTADDVGLTP